MPFGAPWAASVRAAEDGSVARRWKQPSNRTWHAPCTYWTRRRRDTASRPSFTFFRFACPWVLDRTTQLGLTLRLLSVRRPPNQSFASSSFFPASPVSSSSGPFRFVSPCRPSAWLTRPSASTLRTLRTWLLRRRDVFRRTRPEEPWTSGCDCGAQPRVVVPDHGAPIMGWAPPAVFSNFLVAQAAAQRPCFRASPLTLIPHRSFWPPRREDANGSPSTPSLDLGGLLGFARLRAPPFWTSPF